MSTEIFLYIINYFFLNQKNIFEKTEKISTQSGSAVDGDAAESGEPQFLGA